MVQRQDGWSPEDDKVLATKVLKKIREGQTQLSAFQAAAECLNRTQSACGFRWNSTLRKMYAEEIQAAKLERKERKQRKGQSLGTQVDKLYLDSPREELSLPMRDTVQMKQAYTGLEKLYWKLCTIQSNHEEILQVMKKYERICAENERLKQKLFEMEKDFHTFIMAYSRNYFSENDHRM